MEKASCSPSYETRSPEEGLMNVSLLGLDAKFRLKPS